MRWLSFAVLIVSVMTPSVRGDDPPKSVPHRVFATSKFSIDHELTRPYTPEVPFGSTGDRLWATSPQGWAFGHDVHWVFLSNLKAIDLEIADDHGILLPAEATYYPSHVAMKGTKRSTAETPASPLEVNADKFITRDDRLVSMVRIKNPTEKPITVRVFPICNWTGGPVQVSLLPTQGREGKARFGWRYVATWETTLHHYTVGEKLRFTVHDVLPPDKPLDIVESGFMTTRENRKADDLRTDDAFRFVIEPGVTKVFTASLSFRYWDRVGSVRLEDVPEYGFNGDEPSHFRVVPVSVTGLEPLLEHQKQYQRWFDANLAYFDCSDPAVSRMYYHRAYNLKKNMMAPRLGRLSHATQSEGRWRSNWYPNVISYGAGHQIRESRWLRDPKYWRGHLRTWAENERPDGIYPNDIKPTGPDKGLYTDWISSTAWDGHLVHPDKASLAEVVDKLASNVRGWQKVYDPDGDGLLFVDDHWWTGMEWQPSFFADSGYQTDPKSRSQPTKRVNLERVDLTSYNYGNAKNVARIYQALGRPEKAKEFEELAARIAKAVMDKMWNPSAKFFYSLRTSDKTPVDVKEVIGVYPFYFGMVPTGQGYEAAWATILDPDEFWTPWPVASVSKKCPAYDQDGWHFPSSRGTVCMWNGPTWPHANSIVLTGMAQTLRANRGASIPLTAGKFWELFHSFTLAQYRNQDLKQPWTGEFYDGVTAEWKTPERDYNHSTWIDILIADIVGLVPREDETLEIDPLVPAGTLAHFVLDGQSYHGHDVTLVWDAPGGVDVHNDGRSGFDVYLDGKLVASSPSLSRLLVNMTTGKPAEAQR